ncbi:WD40 repeat domain-containing protein [Candidatus Poribacteria bacterium]|nr:WD40 repeat domain-containing protein [Candidatus Poribacteria bacterium]
MTEEKQAPEFMRWVLPTTLRVRGVNLQWSKRRKSSIFNGRSTANLQSLLTPPFFPFSHIIARFHTLRGKYFPGSISPFPHLLICSLVLCFIVQAQVAIAQFPAISSDNIKEIQAHAEKVSAIAFSPGGAYFVSGARDGTIKVWDAGTFKKMRTLAKHNNLITAIAVSWDNRTIASASHDGEIRLWNAQTGRLKYVIRGRSGWINDLEFHPDSHILAYASWDRTVRLWNVTSGIEWLALKGHKRNVTSVSFTPDGTKIASSSWDGTIKIWDVETGELLRTFTVPNQKIESISISDNGRFLVAGTNNGTIMLWNLITEKLMRTFKGHMSNVQSVKFTLDDRYFFSKAYSTVKIWDMQTEDSLTLFSTNKNSVGALELGIGSGNENLWALGISDGRIILWISPPADDLTPPWFELIDPAAEVTSSENEIVVFVENDVKSVNLKLLVSDNIGLEEVTFDAVAILLMPPEESDLIPVSLSGETFMIQQTVSIAGDEREVELYAVDLVGNEQITMLTVKKKAPPPVPSAGTLEPEIVFERGVKWALIVAVGKYEIEKQSNGIFLKTQDTAIPDANALEAFLVSDSGGKYHPDRVIKLTSETEKKPTDQNIMEALVELSTRARREDLVLFHFVGNGAFEETGKSLTSYLLPQNANLTYLSRTAISADELERQLQQIPAKVVLMILDVGFAGMHIDKDGKPIPHTLPPKYYRGFQNTERTSVLFSVAPTQQPYGRQGEKISAFMHFLIKGLEGAADTSGDRAVTFSELALYVPIHVASYVRKTWNAFQEPRSHLLNDKLTATMPIVSQIDMEDTVFRVILDPREALYASNLLKTDPDTLSKEEQQIKAYLVDLLIGAITYDEYLTAVTNLRGTDGKKKSGK